MAGYILSACRTPIGAYLGGLSTLSAPALGAVALAEARARAGLPPGLVPDEVLMGLVVQAGAGQAPARQAALRAGIPDAVPATTINKVCGSGLEAVRLADRGVRAGDGRLYLCGGMESMSRAPHLACGLRRGLRLGNTELADALLVDGLQDPDTGEAMGLAGELCAREQRVSRASQDAWAARSYARALQAWEEGAYAAEVVPVQVGTAGTELVFSRDECPRPTPVEALASLRPVFLPEGSITAGNASSLSDGAAAVVVAAEELLAEHHLRPVARIAAGAGSAREPRRLMMAPADAIRTCLHRAGWREADLYEINEPFAAATVALIEELRLDPERVNVHGGAVALGHPLGATGCRLLVTLLHALARHNLRRGVAALCLGGGEAVALAVELEEHHDLRGPRRATL